MGLEVPETVGVICFKTGDDDIHNNNTQNPLSVFTISKTLYMYIPVGNGTRRKVKSIGEEPDTHTQSLFSSNYWSIFQSMY